jgi:hypothetical protein
MSVYDTTSGSPTLVSGPTAMSLLVGNTYYGRFNPTVGHAYVIYKAVYTDDTYTTLDTDYAQGTESIYAGDFGQTSGTISDNAIVGVVQTPEPITGFLNC